MCVCDGLMQHDTRARVEGVGPVAPVPVVCSRCNNTVKEWSAVALDQGFVVIDLRHLTPASYA